MDSLRSRIWSRTWAALWLLPDKPSDDFAKLWDLTILNEGLTSRGLENVSA